MRKKRSAGRLRTPAHVFSAHFDGEIHGFVRETPVSDAERAWLELAVEVGIRYARDVALTCGPSDAVDVRTRTLDVAIVARAAEALWAACPGAPHWRDLGPGTLSSIVRLRDFAPLKDNVVITLIAFSHFLANHGYLTSSEAVVVRSRLDPHIPEWLIAFGFPRTSLPPELAPS